MTTRQEGKEAHIFCGRWEAYTGYTLFATVGGKEVYLIGMSGRLVHSWEIHFEIGTHATLLPNGNLLCAAKVPQKTLLDLEGAAGKLLEVAWDGSVVWQYEDPYMHHDFHRLPNGNTILLRWVPTPEDIALKVQGGLPNTEIEGTMWSDSLREIDPEGKIIWEWFGYEHLDPLVDIICPLCFRNEWSHANSFVVAPSGDVLISFMKTNCIAIINKMTGNVDWRWGGFGKLGHPHDIAWLDDGSVMVLGSGGHLPFTEPGNSEVLKIDIESGKIIWEYRESYVVDFFAAYKGGLQRLPNGDTLICEGDMGRIFEVNINKEILWEYINPFYSPSPIYGRNNNMVFRAYRYGPDYSGLKGNITEYGEFEPSPAQLKAEKKGKLSGEKTYVSKGEQALRDRLANLGY